MMLCLQAESRLEADSHPTPCTRSLREIFALAYLFYEEVSVKDRTYPNRFGNFHNPPSFSKMVDV